MAKPTNKNDAVMETPKNTGMAVRPAYLKDNDARGTETIQRDDIKIPRLLLAQAMSPQVKRDDPSEIEGLREGDIFNDLTKENLGQGPIELAFLRRDPPHWIEFIPREQGGGIKDGNVPFGDPRTIAVINPKTGLREPPVATQFYDYVAVTLPMDLSNPLGNIVAISMKGANIGANGAAKQINGLLWKRKAPIFASRFTLTSAMTKNAKGSFSVYSVRLSTAVDDQALPGAPGWVSEDVFKALDAIFESIQDKELNLQREPGSDDGDEGLAGDI